MTKKINRRNFLASAAVLSTVPSLAAAAQPGAKSKTTKTATYVLVHGGGHGGWCYQRVARLLRAEGHEVYTPTLTGLGERSHLVSPNVDLDTHITDVVNVMQYEDLTNVILVGHSYGGMVITGAADRSLKRIGHLVFLDASQPKNGASLAANSPLIQEARRQGRIVNGVELVLFPEPDLVKNYDKVSWRPSLQGLMREDLAWMQDKLTPHPWKTFEQPLRLTNEAAIRKIPTTDIRRPDSSTKVPPNVAVKQGEGRWIINAGHDMMIIAPQAVAQILLEIAKTV